MSLFSGMVDIHVRNIETIHKIRDSEILSKVFDNLTIGVNVVSLESYNDIAEYISKLSIEEAKKITLSDVINNIGQYIDNSGRLV
ncbi:MAG: hypothetical protein PHP08_00870 [Candidatus Dojkabacteria bacterium]|nr:hypothetical protein [Candidatus Dojkabacteria bacterium]